MSTIDRVAVRIAVKRNLGDYNSLELSLYLDASVDEGEDALAVARELHERAAAEIKAQYRLRRPPRAHERVSVALAEGEGAPGEVAEGAGGAP